MRRTIHAIEGTAVARIRDELGLSRREFAVRVGVSESYMWRLERGHRQPSPGVRKRITDALGVPLAAIASQHLNEAA